MTRALIIGSSHVGAYKNAADGFAALYPEVELGFFGVRGPLFLAGRMNRKGLFKPPFRDDKDRAFVKATNGTLVGDARGYDHVLLIGHRFAFTDIATLLEEHDILEGVRTGRPRVINEDLLLEVVTTLTRTAVADAVAAIVAFGKPVTFAMAPYPARSLVERGDRYELARSLGLFWARPDAAWVFGIWADALRTEIEKQGHQLLMQPETLNAGPYATKPMFASRAAALDGAELGRTDHRHMNADYGLAMLCAYAENHLGLPPRLDQQTLEQKRIA